MYHSKQISLTLILLTICLFLSCPITANAASTGFANMYRLYNPNTGEHFYTAQLAERNTLVNVGWDSEGIGWKAPAHSDSPVYRLYNPHVKGGDHHYTLSLAEKNKLVRLGWSYEGVGWYSDDNKSVPLYREYNPNAVTGTHNYTPSLEEHNSLIKAGWRDEGVAWYGVENFVGNWKGELSSQLVWASNQEKGQCYGGKINPISVTIKSYDPTTKSARFDADFLIHNHAGSPNAMDSAKGDIIISLRDVLASNESWGSFDFEFSYVGHLGYGYLHDTPGLSDEYTVTIYGSQKLGYFAQVDTSSTYNSYSRHDKYSLRQVA